MPLLFFLRLSTGVYCLEDGGYIKYKEKQGIFVVNLNLPTFSPYLVASFSGDRQKGLKALDFEGPSDIKARDIKNGFFVMSHVILGAAGVVAIVTGFLMLFDTLWAGLSTGVFITVMVIAVAFWAAIVYFAIKAATLRPRLGPEAILGEEGVVREQIGPDGGMVFVHGELWMAFGDDEIPEGAKVRVAGIDGLKLKVNAI